VAFTQRIREELSPLVIKATTQFLKEQVRERLKTALDDDNKTVKDDVKDPAQMSPLDSAAEDDLQEDIRTTDEELEGYRIVRAIVCSEVSANRVIGRDSKTYFAVILDNNSRKPIARLWFNRKQKYLGVFGDDKVETRLPIESPEGIYQYATQLRATVNRYLITDPSGSAVQASSSDAPARSPEPNGIA
jgi:predicted type IV restriction endonuclease